MHSQIETKADEVNKKQREEQEEKRSTMPDSMCLRQVQHKL